MGLERILYQNQSITFKLFFSPPRTNCYRGNCRQISIPDLTSKGRAQPKPQGRLGFIDCQGQNILNALVLNKQMGN